MSASADVRVRTLPVIEVFGPTVQGEGILAGLATYFVRFGGCDYLCLAGETRVLLPNLRERPIAELRAGDAVLGYARDARMGPYRLTPTTVEAWRELPPKPTVTVTLDDGTRLTGSADHRVWREFMREGEVWKNPRLDNYEELARLSAGSLVKGPGQSLRTMPRSMEWKRGYIVGAMDGDGHVGQARIHLSVTSRSFFDTALESSEAVGAPLREYAEAATSHGTRLYRSQLPAAYHETMRSLVADFRGEDAEFCRGYLAGLFDAEGSVPSGHPYIAQNDGPVVGRALAAAQAVGIETEHVRLDGRAHRVLLKEHPVTLLPFLDVGCEEKRLAAGLRGLRHQRRTVVSVEPSATQPLYDIQTGTENFIANGVVSHNCSWCDSMYAVDPAEVRANAEKLTAETIVARLRECGVGPGWVTLSGGNPALLQLGEFVSLLHQERLKVAIETQGSRWRGWLADVDCLTVSPKPPSSGMAERTERDLRGFMAEADSVRLHDQDALKIVVFDEVDLDWAKGVLADYPGWPRFLSCGTDRPDDGERPDTTLTLLADRYRWLCEAVAGDPELADVRVLPQLHVVAWGHARGV